MNVTTPVQATPSDLVREYVWLRDTKRAEEKKFEEWVQEKLTKRMDEIEALLLDHFKTTKTDNFATRGVGTAYKKTMTSVTVADQKEFRRHVIGTEAWELADWRASKEAVKELVAAGEPVPPGVNYSATLGVGIRKG